MVLAIGPRAPFRLRPRGARQAAGLGAERGAAAKKKWRRRRRRRRDDDDDDAAAELGGSSLCLVFSSFVFLSFFLSLSESPRPPSLRNGRRGSSARRGRRGRSREEGDGRKQESRSRSSSSGSTGGRWRSKERRFFSFFSSSFLGLFDDEKGDSRAGGSRPTALLHFLLHQRPRRRPRGHALRRALRGQAPSLPLLRPRRLLHARGLSLVGPRAVGGLSHGTAEGGDAARGEGGRGEVRVDGAEVRQVERRRERAR